MTGSPKNRTLTRLASLAALAISTLQCSVAGSNPSTSEQTLVVNGVTRQYSVHVPPSYRHRPLPLLILLHGHGSSGLKIERSTGMSEKADKAGFIAVYPGGRGDPSGWQVFDQGSGRNEDVAFIAELIDTLKKLYAVDPKRIYVAGHSNGGMMAYRLGVELDHEIAGIAVSAGLLARIFAADTAARMPVTLVAFHGKADNIVPYDAGTGDENYRRAFLSVPASVEAWAKRDGCDGAATELARSNGNVTERRYSGCDSGTTVTLVSIGDLTHRWPGDRHGLGFILDRASLSATDKLWEIFRTHPKE